MAMSRTIDADLVDQKRKDRLTAVDDQKALEQQERVKLRDTYAPPRGTVQLREPSTPHTLAPANTSTPTFKIGEAQGFPYVPDGPSAPDVGNLTPAASAAFVGQMRHAAARPDVASRDMSVQKAAHIVANDFATKHGLAGASEGAKAEVLHAVRAQATFAAREVGAKLGLDPVSSSAIGYSLERALEKEGFKTFVNHAIEGVGSFTSSISATSGATGMRAVMETNLNKSLSWMADHGMDRAAVKEAVGKHMGKLQVLAEMATHPEAFQRAAQIIGRSDTAADMVRNIATDDELRKSIGTLTLATGETVGMVNKGAGSAVILAGAMLKGESVEDVGRHAFRAVMSVAGGAAGGVAAGMASAGFGTVAGGIAGSMAGSYAADKILAAYDEITGHGKSANTQEHLAGKDELKASAAVIADRARGAAGNAARSHDAPEMKDRMQAIAEKHPEMGGRGGQQREYGHTRQQS